MLGPISVLWGAQASVHRVLVRTPSDPAVGSSVRKGSSDARWRQFLGGKRCLPGQAMIHDQRTSETQLDIRQHHQPGPAVRRLWAATRQGDLADLDRAPRPPMPSLR